MRSYRDLSIVAKLNLLVLLSGSIALFLSTICFVWNDISLIRSSMIKQMTILANVLGSESTAPLEFLRDDDARELLKALRQEPAVEFAVIYNHEGKPFANYHRLGAKFRAPAVPDELGPTFVDGFLDVVQEIRKDGDPIGAIFLRANLDEQHEQILRYIAIVAAMVLISLVTSVLLSSRFLRVISAPIVKLAEAAKHVSENRDFGIRVIKVANDELGALYDQFNEMLEQIQKGESAIEKARDELEAKVVERTAELSLANQGLSRENAVRIEAELQLESTHQKLVEAARRAGMAEIATSVLHNVGNALNSINVSATLVSERMRQSKVCDLIKVAGLLELHAQNLSDYISSDSKGKQLLPFLRLLSIHLADERTEIASELELLTTKVAHVKVVIATQQSYAGISGVIEEVDLSTTLDDAMKLSVASFQRENVTVVKDFQDMPKVRIDKQRTLQILVNLIKNAREAFQECPNQRNRTMTVRTIVKDEEVLQIHIIDNAIGINFEDLTRIFSFGFTTKKTGHGFGLHSCANAAHEMGGSLTAHSDGLGRGASFILELPYSPVE